MKASQFSSAWLKRRKAMALIMVVTVVALMSILMVAMFSITRTEYKSTQVFVAEKSAKQLADIATAIVQGQIENAQNPNGQNATVSSQMYTHATQPGMVRTYDYSGAFYAAYKLYSSSTMKVTGAENSLYTDQHVPPSNWSSLTARYVDLNDPVIRAGLTSGTYAVYFPILDPRASWNYGGGGQGVTTPGTTAVEGFSYTKTAPSIGSGGGQDYSNPGPSGTGQVITANDTSNPDNMRVPMPVEWLYVLQDGTLGALDSSNTFISSNSTPASATNPIVGRIAFWTDDESCKININTASEPTFSNSPFYFHERDVKWAHYPPVTGEYQRYPGHPATVALSAVIAPYYTLDPLMPSWDGLSSYANIVSLKESIYQSLAPKLSPGGSKCGTLPFAIDQLTNDQTFGSVSTAATSINLSQSTKERLYATVDEMLFKDDAYNTSGSFNDVRSTSGGRSKSAIQMPGSGRMIFDHDTLEHSRFFLTAQSRSPEFSIHGLPRICMWPIADESKGANWRTTFDNLTAFCSTLVKNATSKSYSYSFRRAYARDYIASQSGANPDVYISRNQSLLTYLVNQMSQLSWPQTSYQARSAGANTFVSKYGTNNVNQMAVQFFDYIRCTNLYDGIEARNNNASSMYGQSAVSQYQYSDANYGSCYTFTSQRTSPPPTSVNVSGTVTYNTSSGNNAVGNNGTLPGHGQVSPSLWSNGGVTYKGLGRMFTISEIGFQFVCTGDGYSHQAEIAGSSVAAQTPGAGVQSLMNTFPKCIVGVVSPFDGKTYFGDGGGTAHAYSTAVAPTNPTQLEAAALVYGGALVTAPGSYYYSNFPPLSTVPTKQEVDFYMALYGCQAAPSGKGGTSSNLYHPSTHPGFYAQNWNMTLAQNTPLRPNERRIQVMLMLEFFCPSVGWTGMNPEWTILLDNNIAQMAVNGQPLFDTTSGVDIKSNGNVYDSSAGAHAVGGHAGPTAIAGGRLSRTISLGGGNVMMPADVQHNSASAVSATYGTGNTSGHNALQNYAFCSNFITVDASSGVLNLNYPGTITIKIYDTHNYTTATPVQLIDVDLSKLPPTVPTPRLAGSLPYTSSTDNLGRVTYTRARLGPHYWAANFAGCLNRFHSIPNPAFTTGQSTGNVYTTPFWGTAPQPNTYAYNSRSQALQGRLDTSSTMYGDSRTGIYPQGVSVVANGATDVVCSLVPAAGDYRTLAAKYHVTSDWWQAHPMTAMLNAAANIMKVHSFTSNNAGVEPGCILATDSAAPGAQQNQTGYQLVADAAMYMTAVPGQSFLTTLNSRQPDLPPGQQNFVYPANAFGDFDTGISGEREGPYINKPDEGNFYVEAESSANYQTYRSAYFYNDWGYADDWRSGIYMTPNRLISSPVMFGSLPTGVWGSNGLPSASQSGNWPTTGASGFAPWQTLLFRPHIYNTQSSVASQQYHPGMENPCDHYLLDLFFMPVVEPYAISEPLTIAGRINMNYQIMPFINIRRATGMHALMKGEFMTAVPNGQIAYAKSYKSNGGSSPAWQQSFFSDSIDKYYWHRPIDPAATLRQFDLKFGHKSGGTDKYQGLFRSATQICEMHLIPKTLYGTGISNAQGIASATSQDAINQTMNTFWSNNRPTGDNVRERPYSNLYARLTTRSNTFRVHVRAQVLKKARSSTPTVVDPTKDAVISEYRGSTLLERYIDPNDTTQNIPDYAAGSINQAPLDSFFRFHVLESKRFNP